MAEVEITDVRHLSGLQLKFAKDATGSDVILWSQNVSEDYKYGVSGVVDGIVATDEVNKKSPSFLWTYFKFKILKKAML